jgi:RNA-directed DNA polymerase
VAEVRHFTSRSYEWIVEGDIEACFDEISHSALMDRVRNRIGDKRVLALVKAFLKAGVLAESGAVQGTQTGTPQGGILSPVLANVALSVLDERFADKPGGPGCTDTQRARRRRRGEANYRLVRYADLCRRRHKSAYAEDRVMPTWVVNCLVSGVGSLLVSA